jgi:hypothetical protein
VIVLALYVSGVSVELSGREMSFAAIGDAVGSVLGAGADDDIGSNYLDTTNWRAEWWSGIWDDVTARWMVVHGHGWGDNLAVRYDVVPAIAAVDPRVLRLPHDLFFSLAGRSGLAVAAAFLLVPVLTVARTFARGGPRLGTLRAVEAARAGVVAAVVTGLTDVYIESPQGGIVFWCLIGFLWWATASHADAGEAAGP